tara:strand:+ start:228 stop:371 length:144 start_codon:yes stop_codon:yes gene_type:complete
MPNKSQKAYLVGLIDEYTLLPLVLLCYFMEQSAGLYSSALIWVLELF